MTRSINAKSERMQDASVHGVRTRVVVQVEDSGGTFRDITDLVDVDFVASVEWGESLNQGGIDGTVSLWVEHYDDSLSPLSNSRLNDIIDAWREIKIYVGLSPYDVEISDSDLDLVVHGRIDNYDLSGEPGTIEFRDKILAELTSDFIESVSEYGDDGGSKQVQDVVQDIIDDHYTYGSLTLDVVDSTTFEVKSYNLQKGPVFQSLKDVAVKTVGFDLRVRYDAGTFKLQLYEPDRAASTTDLLIPSDQILSYSRFSVDIKNIRNVVTVWYRDESDVEASGESKIKSVSFSDTTSINNYGRRFMELAGDATNLLTTQAEAETLAQAALDDLSTPTLEAGVEINRLYHQVQLNDIIELEADSYLLATNQQLACVGYSHSVNPEGATTQLELRGQPIASHKDWTDAEARPGKAHQVDDFSPRAPVLSVTPSATGVKAESNIPDSDRDWDSVEIHTSESPGISPTSSTLEQWARTSSVNVAPFESWDPATQVDKTFYIIARFRDREGNYGANSNEESFTPNGIGNEHLGEFLRTNFSYEVSSNYLETTSGANIEYDQSRYSFNPSGDQYDTANFRWQNLLNEGIYDIKGALKIATGDEFTSGFIRAEILNGSGAQVQTYDGNVITSVGETSTVDVDYLVPGEYYVQFLAIFTANEIEVEAAESFFSISSKPGPTA